jgi:hypothetical protein
MQQRPEIAVAFYYYMPAPSAIAAIRPGKGVKFCAGKMFAAGAAMAAFAENPYLVNEVGFLHCKHCGGKSKRYWVGELNSGSPESAILLRGGRFAQLSCWCGVLNLKFSSKKNGNNGAKYFVLTAVIQAILV